jgi:hypothetical protein
VETLLIRIFIPVKEVLSDEVFENNISTFYFHVISFPNFFRSKSLAKENKYKTQ